MPAAVAIPAAMSAVGIGVGALQNKNAQKQAQQNAANQGTDPATLARNREQLQQFQNTQYTPAQLQQMLSTGPGGQQIGAYQGAGAWDAPNISPYQNTNWAEVAKMQARTPQEQAALAQVMNAGGQSLGQANDLNAVSMPQLQAVSARNLALLGGSKSAASNAIAPQAEQMAEIQRGAQRGLEAQAGLRGGAKQQALAESARLGAGQIASLIPQAQQQAMTSAAQLGTSGQQLRQGALGQAGALYNQAQAAEAQNRQFGIGAEQANRQLGGQLELGASGQALQNVLGRGQLDLTARGQDLGNGQNILSSLLAQRGQNLQALLGQMGNNTSLLGQQGNQFLQQQQLNGQQQAGMGSTAAGLFQNYLNWRNSQPSGGAMGGA